MKQSKPTAAPELDYFGQDTGGRKKQKHGAQDQLEIDAKFEKHAPVTTDVKQWRKKRKINAQGEDLPLPMTSFTELKTRFKVKRYLRDNMLRQ